jgi:hypothetical protein
MKTMKQETAEKQQAMLVAVGKLLNMTEQQLNELKFEFACQYMEGISDTADIAQEFLSEPMFWNWWHQQWALVDEAFVIQSTSVALSRATMRRWYETLHREIDSYPDSIIWEQIHANYSRMADKIIHKKMAI